MRWTFLITVIPALVCACTPAEPEGKRLTAGEIDTLLRGQTVVGFHEKKSFRFRRFFDPGGDLRAVNDKHGSRRGRWRIDEQGQHCVKFNGTEEHCRIIVRGQDDVYRKYGLTWYGYYRQLITYADFRDGEVLTAVE